MANGYRNTLVVNKVACDRVIYQKGESNVSKI